MPISYFANPGKFMRFAERIMPWLAGFPCCCSSTALSGPVCVAAPTRAGRNGSYHVCACAGGMDRACCSTAAWRWRLPSVSWSRHLLTDIFCLAAAPVGAVLTATCLITGSIWGEPDLGNMVGMGCAADQRFDPFPALLRLYRSCGNRSTITRRAAGAGSLLLSDRRRQYSDHPFFGSVVEYAASTIERFS